MFSEVFFKLQEDEEDYGVLRGLKQRDGNPVPDLTGILQARSEQSFHECDL